MADFMASWRSMFRTSKGMAKAVHGAIPGAIGAGDQDIEQRKADLALLGLDFTDVNVQLAVGYGIYWASRNVNTMAPDRTLEIAYGCGCAISTLDAATAKVLAD